MQSLAFLWFQLQMTRQYLREKTFPPAQLPAKAANWNEPIGIRDPSTRRSGSLPNSGCGRAKFHLWPMSRRWQRRSRRALQVT
jgi:hypothetical protein